MYLHNYFHFLFESERLKEKGTETWISSNHWLISWYSVTDRATAGWSVAPRSLSESPIWAIICYLPECALAGNYQNEARIRRAGVQARHVMSQRHLITLPHEPLEWILSVDHVFCIVVTAWLSSLNRLWLCVAEALELTNRGSLGELTWDDTFWKMIERM